MKFCVFLSLFFTLNSFAKTTVLTPVEYPLLHYSISEEYPYRANVAVIPPLPVCEARSEEKTKGNQKFLKKKNVGERDTNFPIKPVDTQVNMTHETAQIIGIQKLEQERQMAESGSTSFTNIDDFFNSIIDEPDPNCGYRLGGPKSPYPRPDINKFCAAMNDLANDRPVSAENKCHISNCTTASYMAIIQTMQTRSDWDEKKHLFECSRPWPAAYSTYKGANGLIAFAQEYDLGSSRRMTLTGPEARGKTKAQILQDFLSDGFPRKSDPLLLQRLPTRGFPSGSGHAVIFSHFETASGQEYSPDQGQQISKVCYWSSNGSTNGAGTRCEDISIMQSIHTAQIRQ